MVDVFSKLVRLSYYGNVAGKVPEVYMQIFPPKPEAQSLESKVPQEADGVDAMTDDTPSSVDALSSVSDLEKKWALTLIQLVNAYVYS